MSAGHTPGPHWVEGSIYEGYAACVVGRVAVEGAVDRETRTLAQVRSLPDAILYAAATEMLEALSAVSVIRPANWDDDDDPDQVAAWRMVDAAIAKATGAA